MTKKFFDMIGYDPAAVQGSELTDVFDTEQVVAARQEYDNAVASYEAEQEENKQDFVEFYVPDEEYVDWFLTGKGRGSLIPGVRFPTVANMAEQDLGRLVTVPMNIASERRRLGGGIFDNPWARYEPADAELDTLIEKYNLNTRDPLIAELFDATSKEDLEARAVVVSRRQEREAQIALDSPGVAGFVQRMGVNIFDPVMLLSGQAASSLATRAVLNSTTKTGAALRFANDGLKRSELFKIGAVSTLAADVPLELASSSYDVERDPAMTLAFMALAPLVGGTFNTLGRSLDDNEALSAAIALDEAIAKGIVPPDFKGTDSGAGGAAQSGAVPRTVDEDGIPGTPPRSSAWTFGTPLNFLARSADPITRLVAGRLSNNPWTGGSKGTTAFEAQRRIYNAQSVAIRDLRMAAKEYFGKGVTSPTTAQLDDFFKQVGQHLEGYSISENPAVIRAADALRPKYADGLAYLQDPNYLPGREKPSSSPTAPAGSPPAPPAPKAPEGPEAAPAATPEAPEPVTTATPDAPEPVTPVEPDALQASSINDLAGGLGNIGKAIGDSFRQGWFDTLSSGPKASSVFKNEPRWAETEAAFARGEINSPDELAAFLEKPAPTPGRGRDYFGRKSFRSGPAEEPEAPSVAPEGAASQPSGSPVERLTRSIDEGPDAFDNIIAELFADKSLKNADLAKIVAEWTGDARSGLSRKQMQGILKQAFDYRYKLKGRSPGSPSVAPEGATSRLPDEGIVEPPKPTDRVPPTIKTLDEKIAQVKAATQQVIEAAPEGPPSRTDLRRALQGYVEAAEAIAFATPDANTAILDAAAQMRRYIAGASAGTNKTFYAKYLDGLQRLTNALEDVDDDAADKLLASVIDDLDNGYGSKLSAELNKGAGLMASRAGGLERNAEAEQVRAENAELYETFKSAFDFGQGPYKKPSVATATAVAGAGAAAGAAAVAIYEDAPDEVKAGITALAAGIGLAAGFATGKARVRHWELNTPSIGIFAGPMAKGVDLKALQKAQKMEKAGADRDVIWRETGWGRMGPAGEWLTEIRDPMGGLNDMLTDLKVRLGDVLDAPKIMRAYADLYEVRMQTGELLKFLMDTQADGVANLGGKTMAVRTDMNRAEQLRVAIHEINHLIQGQRNRQVPGATEMNDRAMDAWKELNKVSKEYDDLFYQVQYELEAGPEKTAAIERLDELAQQIDELNPASREFYQYLTLDLEAESRLVETRLGLTAKQARERPPWNDLDVEEGDLWMARQVGRYAASLGSDVKAFRDQTWWDENVEEGVFGPDHELNGQRYWKNDQVYAWVEDIGDGEGSFNWDWIENVESGKLFEDNPNASPAQSARAFAFAQVSLERTLKSGEFTVVTFEGLKKPKPGQDASGHERVQEFLMGRADTTGYVATKGSWKIKLQGQETTRSSFAFIREGMDVEETWKGIRRGKVEIKEIAKAPKREPQLAASRSAPGSATEVATFETPGSPEYEAAVAKGLDMSTPARMARAKEQGFDTETVLYHGTDKKFDAFRAGDRGIFLGDKETASTYGEPDAYYIRGELAPRSVLVQVKKEIKADREKSFFGKLENERPAQQRELVKRLKAMGYAGYKQGMGIPGALGEVVIFDPSNIRSVNAAFDPSASGSANLLASRRAPDAEPPTPPKAPEAGDDYKGLEEWRNVTFDQGYQPRQFNQQGWRRVISSAEYRNNPTKLGNRFGDLFLRNDPQRFEELGQRLGISAQEAAWRTGRKYIATVADLMNGRGLTGPKANRINPADREAAKEIVREMLNKGDPFDETSEEALELILDIVAPVRKASAESPRARPRMNFKLSKEFDEDIADIFEWNAEKLFVSYSRHISGYAGILRAGYRSVAELNNEIKQIRENAKFDSQGRINRADKEVALLEAMRDAILGVPPKEDLARPEWQFVVNQIRRLNFGNLMNNVGFLALSEVAGALTRVNVVKMFKLFPEYQRYIKLARAGDPKAQENIFYMADVTMGHGSAQLRSRVGSVEDRASGEAPSLEDRTDGVKDYIDRITRKQANAVARFSGMSPIQEWLRMTIVTAEAQDWVKAARSGKPPYEARRMAQMGIDAAMWQRISAELRKWGDINSPDTRRPVPNMDLSAWEDDEALNFFINALDRNANRIVMEGDLGHTALFFRNKPSASLFFQFLNFPLNAFTKHLGFAARTRDVRAAAEVLAMMMGGAAGYVARVHAQANAQDTEEEKQKILAERLTDAEIGKAMLYYSAHGSVIPNVLDLGLWLGEIGGIPNPIPGYEGETVKPLFNKNIRASGVPGNPITGNPTISRATQIPQSIGAMATGTAFSEQDVQGAIKALAPFGNHIAVTALLDRMLEFLPDEEDSVEAAAQQ